jgi:hypothetical protein
VKILYIDPISTPTARANVVGIRNAYSKHGEVLLFDYRAGIPRKNRAKVPAVRAMNARLLNTGLGFKPDLIHAGKCETVLASTLQQIKDKTGAFLFHAFGDWRHELQPYVWQIGSIADVTGFSNMHPGLNAKYRAKGVRRIEFWCSGCDTSTYKPAGGLFRYDSVFMANMGKMSPSRVSLQGPREKFIYALARAGISVHLFGRNNQVQARRHPRVFSHDYVAGARFATVCSAAKLALGFGVHNVRNYTSWPRLVNSMGSGAFYLTRYFLGLEDFFQNKKHLVWFKSIPEAVSLAKYYMEHDEERQSIAAAGRQEILAHHTWDARVTQVLKWAGLA